MSNTSTAGRVPELDAVRGLAAAAIVVTHLPRGFWFGETGVDLFFVMSGYLISAIIYKNLDQPGFLKAFLVRRSLRIWPIYYLSLLVVVGLSFIRRTPSNYEGWWYYVLYLQNVSLYWGEPTPPFVFSLGHTWTLAIEEQFYLVWPVVLLVFGRRAIVPLGVTLIVSPILFRAVGVDRVTLLAHSEGFGWGAVLSVMARGGLGRWRVLLLVLVGAAALAGYAIRVDELLAAGVVGKKVITDNAAIALVNAIYFAVIGLVVAGAGSRYLAPLRWRPLVYLGQISYGLYLYHWIMFEQIDTVLKFGRGYQDPLWLDAVKVAASLAVAIASWHLIEQPLLGLKSRFEYKRPVAPGTSAVDSRGGEPGHPVAAVADADVPEDRKAPKAGSSAAQNGTSSG